MANLAQSLSTGLGSKFESIHGGGHCSLSQCNCHRNLCVGFLWFCIPPPPSTASPLLLTNLSSHNLHTHTQLVITHLFTQLSHTHFVTHNFAHTHPLSSPTWPHTTCALKLRSHMGHMSSVLRECQQTCFIMAPKTGPKKLLKLR